MTLQFHTLGLSAALLSILHAAPAWSQSVRLLDHLILGESKIDGEKIGEFSALVAAPDGNGLIAVSDRGYLARLAVTITGEDLAAVEVVSVHVLTGPDGRALRDEGVSPEAAAVLPDGSLAIVDETTARLMVFDTMGTWLRDELLPEALRDTGRQASEKDGVEALAWTETTGFLAMTEEPQLGFERNDHTLRTALAGDWPLVIDGPESVSIKGMEAAEGRIFLLGRTRDDITDALRPYLRILDHVACQSARACTGTTYPVSVPGIEDADFEGIAALGDGLLLLVSDDKVGGDLRSVFALIAVE
ncbi:hypothetical protein C0V75_21320 [Tabrizicola sp. TH137]|uniref:esterase-like activity of phytase family protein n=1 Tax=Tabrizicola sp. TH137 TaxID=2067452 RepID=UPI000C79E839|nr:esterase-like activity of phytase family protein [Tabrizicola sp. TH137]PLL10310.1 hypothetical protein C0V75_21320 [Tabrizicola sp. TH137]